MMGSVSRLLKPSLESQLASELRALVREFQVGDQFTVAPSADICSSLELFLPQVLRIRYREWLEESLDGIFVARALKTGPAAAQLAGTCILISDQTVTPSWLTWNSPPRRIPLPPFGCFSANLAVDRLVFPVQSAILEAPSAS
jgi:hypothetical protein